MPRQLHPPSLLRALLLAASLASLTTAARAQDDTQPLPLRLPEISARAPQEAAAAPASQTPPASSQTPPPASLPELIRRVKPAVVAVVTYDAKGNVLLSGSGFFIRPGRVVTNLHVVEGARRAEVKTLDGKGRVYPVEGLLSVDEEGDLAVLSVSVPSDRARAAEVTESVPEEGEQVFVIGNPLRLEGSISDGIISAVREVPNLGRIIQTTAPVSHGNSGSPLFNMRGQVVGVITVKVTNGQNINLALASSRFGVLKAERLTSFEELAVRSKTPESSADWWYRNGLNSLWLGNYDGALASFESAVNKNPDRAEAWIQVGYCKVKQGRSAEAVGAYKRALRLRPNSVEAYNKLGDAYYFMGSFAEAVGAYKQAARLRPDLAEAFYNLGMTYLELGDRAAALTQSRRLEPLDAELYGKLMAELRR
ncbi:MAG: tetratricopeptide repeat-containing serine protease family protein [Acidobacteria bacterium]|nr:tetratricopeptide repeat-containing serine protease family protein [Acidobacteriota bacterium]